MGGFIFASVFLFSASLRMPLLVLRVELGVNANPPLCRRGSPLGAGMVLPSKSCLVRVVRRLGVKNSSSLNSSASIFETL